MANDKLLPQDINKQAEYYSGFNENEDHTPISKGKYYGYIAGATAWAPWKVKHDELSDENSVLRQKNTQIESRLTVCEKEVYDHRKEYQLLQAKVNELDAIVNLFDKLGDCALVRDSVEAYKRKKALQQFKDGKGKEDKVYRPCPDCGKELFRDRNLCCRACGKEVENE